MPTITELEARLNAIASSLQNSEKVNALLGLGSIGIERSRLDEYSDLDFFVIVKEGHKKEFINDLWWLTEIHPAAYHFQNTVDGHKFLYADNIFCEFAVFEANELKGIPFSKGRVIWSEPKFDTQHLEPINQQGIYQRNDDVSWLVGEALTNLYVGLGRYQRGEKLSAMRFVQSFALDRIIDLINLNLPEKPGDVDQYMPDRRIEKRFDQAESLLTSFCQGYSKTPESALAQLEWLEKTVEVNKFMAERIRSMV